MEPLPLNNVKWIFPIVFLLYLDVPRVRSCECERIHEGVIPSFHSCDPANAQRLWRPTNSASRPVVQFSKFTFSADIHSKRGRI